MSDSTKKEASDDEGAPPASPELKQQHTAAAGVGLGDATNNDGVYTEQQYFILGLLNKYSDGDVGDGEDETWIRRVPFLVYIFEGIVQKVIDYDYAPSFVFFDKTYYKMSVSQQFNTDLDELIMCNHVRAIKLSTKWHTSGLAYQISLTGKAVLKKGFLGDDDNGPKDFNTIMEELNSYTTSPGGLPKKVEFVSEDGFYLTAADMGPEPSGITETEDVSYVTSPWVPTCMIHDVETLKEMHSNADRAHEAATAGSNIKDELDELVALQEVHIMVAEWVPFGANQVFALNDKLGSAEKMQGGLFLAQLDLSPNEQEYTMPHSTGLTSVNVTDYQMDRFITFKADIQYPEDEGIIQIEEFGVSCRDFGGCYYGMKMEAIQHFKADHISIDLLSRVLVDITDDSSTLLDSLVSSYQRQLLQTCYSGHAENRSKYNIIMCESFELPDHDEKHVSVPALAALLEKDKSYENEIKQVTGDIQWFECVGENEGLIAGVQGLLYFGDADTAAPMLSIYGALRGMSMFHQAFFRRIFTLHDVMHELREEIENAHKDPESGRNIRAVHADAEQTVLLLKQVMEFLGEALVNIQKEMPKAPPAEEVERTKLFNALNLKGTAEDLSQRIQDMGKNIDSTIMELTQLYNGIVNIESRKSFQLYEAIDENTKNLEDQVKSSERGSRALEVMQIILAGNLAFDVMDRWTGDTPMGDEGAGWWFLISMCLFALLGFLLTIYSRRAGDAAEQVMMIKFKLNVKVDKAKMAAYLNSKPLAAESYEKFQAETDVRKVVWEEDDDDAWSIGGKPPATPEIVLQYDHQYGHILQVYLTMMKAKDNMMTDAEVKACLLADFKKHGVLPEPEPQGFDRLVGHELGSPRPNSDDEDDDDDKADAAEAAE